MPGGCQVALQVIQEWKSAPSDRGPLLGSTLLFTAGFIGLFLAIPNPAEAHTAGGLILIPLMLSLLPVLAVLVALIVKWPVTKFLFPHESERLAAPLLLVTLAEILLNVVSWMIARSLSEGDFLTAIVNFMSPELGEWYEQQGTLAHNSALIFWVMYLTMTATQFVVTILPNALLLRSSKSGLRGVFGSGRRLLATLAFALIAPLLAGFIVSGFSEIEQQRAEREQWQSLQRVVPTPRNTPMIVVQSPPPSVHAVPVPGPQAHVAPISPRAGATVPSQNEPPVMPKSKQSEFLEAAQAGDVAAVQRILPEVGTNAVSVRNAILRAARNGHLDVIKTILDNKGATIDSADLQALLDASEAGHLDVVKFLVDGGADVNAKGANKQTTALILASRHGQTEIVKFLLDKGADVNAIDLNRDTALRLAVLGNYAETVRVVLEKGADPDIEAPIYATPLELAAEKGQTETVRMLLSKGANVNARSSHGKPPLISAASQGYTDIVIELLNKGADPNTKTANDDMPLILAATKGHTEIVKLLLRSGADVNAQCKYGTPLIVSASNLEMVRLLLDGGADVNAKAPNGETALRKAQTQNLSRTARLLKKYGAK
jgi:ankyrin repeat protein